MSGFKNSGTWLGTSITALAGMSLARRCRRSFLSCSDRCQPRKRRRTCSWAHQTKWSAKGAEFLTEPKDHGREIRAYIRDPDGHLIEVGQATGILN